MKNRHIITLVLLSIGLITWSPSAHALWPFGSHDDKPVAPDPEYRARECDPYQQKAQEVFQAKAWYKQPWSNIRYANLKRKHRECLDKFRDAEYDYLKQVDIKPAQPAE